MAKQYGSPDFWTQKARKEGYPARSVYKLEEILQKGGVTSDILRGSANLRLLDLGAAPGSWSLYLLRKFGGGITLLSCDLLPLSREFDKGLFDGGNFSFIQGDFTEAARKASIIEHGPFDALFSDAAPATTGVRLVDTAKSEELVEQVLDYAQTALRPGGSLVVKLFQGEGTADFSRKAAPLFDKSRFFKPAACRTESFETFFIGSGKR
jgi:23S rRNA (uridine2552-2'-O)-methyltransferase